jgi:hypothetical protein
VAARPGRPRLVMRNGNGNRLTADQANTVHCGYSVDDRSADPHPSLTPLVEVTRAEKVGDLQAETVWAIVQGVLMRQHPDNLVLLEVGGPGRFGDRRGAEHHGVVTGSCPSGSTIRIRYGGRVSASTPANAT